MLKFIRIKIWFDSAMNAFNTYTLQEALFMSLDFVIFRKNIFVILTEIERTIVYRKLT